MSALRDALRDLSDAVFFDLLESDEAYLVVLDVPGVVADTLEVGVDGGRLTIEATRAKDVPGEYRYLEENRSMYLDVDLPLPADAHEEGAEASISRGVLELRLPKRGADTETTMTIDVVDGDDADRTTDDGSGNGV